MASDERDTRTAGDVAFRHLDDWAERVRLLAESLLTLRALAEQQGQYERPQQGEEGERHGG